MTNPIFKNALILAVFCLLSLSAIRILVFKEHIIGFNEKVDTNNTCEEVTENKVPPISTNDSSQQYVEEENKLAEPNPFLRGVIKGRILAGDIGISKAEVRIWEAFSHQLSEPLQVQSTNTDGYFSISKLSPHIEYRIEGFHDSYGMVVKTATVGRDVELQIGNQAALTVNLSNPNNYSLADILITVRVRNFNRTIPIEGLTTHLNRLPIGPALVFLHGEKIETKVIRGNLINDSNTEIEFEISKANSIQCQVVDSSGDHINNVVVTDLNLPYREFHQDENGAITITGISKKGGGVKVSAVGYASRKVIFNSKDLLSGTMHKVLLRKNLVIQGRIKFYNKNDNSRAFIQCKQMDIEAAFSSLDQRSTLTDEEGHFSLSGFRSSSKRKQPIHFVISSPKTSPLSFAMFTFVKEGAVVDIGDIWLCPPQFLRGQIISESGESISKAKVIIKHKNKVPVFGFSGKCQETRVKDWFGITSQAFSNKSGLFQLSIPTSNIECLQKNCSQGGLESFENQDYEIVVFAPGFIDYRNSLHRSELSSDLKIKLKKKVKAHSLEVKLLNRWNEPVLDAKLQLSKLKVKSDRESKSDNEGLAVFDIESHTGDLFRLSVKKKGYKYRMINTVLTDSHHVETAELIGVHRLRIKGELLDEFGIFELSRSDTSTVLLQIEHKPDGELRIEKMPPGRYSVRWSTKDGIVVKREFEFSKNNEEVITVDNEEAK